MLRVVRGDDRRSWGILAGRFRRPIDPGGCWERFGPWWPLDGPLGMGGVRGQTEAVPDGEDRGGAAVVDVGRRERAEAAVMVRVVVPREQIAADAARVFERAEPVRKLGAVLQGPELRFRERMCCNFSKAARERLVESAECRFMPPPQTACGGTESVAERPNRSPTSPVPFGSCVWPRSPGSFAAPPETRETTAWLSRVV